jgi:hypothetical protein
MSDQTQVETRQPVSSNRLWFGFAGAAAAWVLAGLLNVLLAWQACMGGEAGSFIFTQTGIRVVLGIITFALLAVAVVAGLISFRNWRDLSREPDFLEAEGRSRKEFMAIFGVVVSASLTMGLIWFAIPIYVISMCVRAH